MRRPAAGRPNRGRKADTYSVPAPVRGWNARDSIAAMKPGDAVALENWFPTPSDVMLRKGMAAHLTAVQDSAVDVQVETLLSYRPPSGAHSLWAFAGTKLFNATAAGAAPAASVSSLTNARWQHINFTTTGGNFAIAVNGADELLLYNGTAWASIDGASTPAITNVATTALVHVNVFKERVFYVETGSMSVWYTAVGEFAGALVELNLGSIFKRGGYLMAMATWTLDGGSGIDDYAVFITSEGEVAVYQGTNPASADTWALVGIYNIAEPIGRRCFVKYAGDLLIVTKDGVVPASRALAADRTSSAVAVSDRISGALRDAASLYSTNFGWQLQHFPAAGMLLLNVPISTGAQQQYVMNTVNGAWCKFKGWYANCWEVHNGNLYFGTLGAVRQAWTGTADLSANIVAEAIGAFDYLGNRDGLKKMNLIRPVIGWDSNPAEFLLGVDVDFVTSTPTNGVSFPSSSGGVWDSGLWDVALWGGDITLNRNWYTAAGVGYAFAPHLKISSSRAQVRWSATDYSFKRGGVL
jgi:hypothetical protein